MFFCVALNPKNGKNAGFNGFKVYSIYKRFVLRLSGACVFRAAASVVAFFI